MAQFKGMTMNEAMKLLEKLERDSWLKSLHTGNARGSHTDKKITLGIRTVLDLRRYIET